MNIRSTSGVGKHQLLGRIRPSYVSIPNPIDVAVALP